MIGCGIVALFAATPARADVGVVIVPAASAPAASTELTAALDEALADASVADASLAVRTDALGVARAAARDGAVPAEALAGFARVDALIDEGWRAYLEVHTEFALGRLGEARRQAEALLPLEGGARSYAEAALKLGAALDNAKKADEADEVLRLAHALDPDREVTLQEFSPDVVAAWQRAQAATVARRALRVTARAAGGGGLDDVTVELDGVAIEVTADVAIGQHVVVVRAGQMRALGQTISVPAGDAPLELEVELDSDPAAVGLADGPAAGQREPEAGRWVDAVLAYAELDGLVIASSVWRGKRPAVLVQWCDGSPATCTAVVEVGYDDASGLGAATRAALADALAARTGQRYGATMPSDARVARSSPPVVIGRGCRWCRPALYLGAGVVVIAATAIAFALAADDERVTSIGIDPGDFTGD